VAVSGLFTSDCAASEWAWLDAGCLVQNAVTDVGSAIGSGTNAALQPVYNLLWFLGGLIVVILLIVGFAPNVRHIIPHVGLG
jgi:hypothetical protein